MQPKAAPHSPGTPLTCYRVEDDFEPLILLPPFSQVLCYRHCHHSWLWSHVQQKTGKSWKKEREGGEEGEKLSGGRRELEDRQAGSPLENKAIKRMGLTLGQTNQTQETLGTMVIDTLKAQWQR